MKDYSNISNIGVGNGSYEPSNESYEHMTCKMTICENLEINCEPKIKLKRAEPEKHNHILTGKALGFTPDIQAITEDDELIFIEIVKTSDIDDKKMKLIEDVDVTTIKIYVDNTYAKFDKVKIHTAYCKKSTLYNHLYKKSIEKLNIQKDRIEKLQNTLQDIQLLINKNKI